MPAVKNRMTMTYIENIRKDGRSANPFFCLMGIDVVSARDGEAVLSMQVRPDMMNGVGWLQGGVLAAIADEAMALALYTRLSGREGIATISESTTFVRGVREGTIIAKGRVIKKGRRVAFTEGEVYAGDEGSPLLSRTSAAFALTTEE
jgi:acyl-CoA thioesterase